MADYTKPLPTPDADSAPFWEGCKEHRLLAQRCARCGTLRWPPQGVCPACYSWDAAWQPVSERGTVASFVVVHQAPPAFRDVAPYTIARITLDDTDGQVQILSNVVDCPWEEVRVGMLVQAVYDDVTPEITLPKFRPA
jgi:uncharacterized OB-fold protein